MGGSCGCLVGYSWGGGRQASRVATDVFPQRGGGGVEHDPSSQANILARQLGSGGATDFNG